MAERFLNGRSASPGAAVGAIRMLDGTAVEPGPPVATSARAGEGERALAALAAAGAQLARLANDLRARGRSTDAELVDTGVLMAADPGLRAAVTAAILERGSPGAQAIAEATGAAADTIAGLPDETLAARADDVRSLGRRAMRLLAGDGSPTATAAPAYASVVLVARDLGPADVAELEPDVCALALAGGGTTAHAAIVARSLGLPMVVGLGDRLLEAEAGEILVIDGDGGLAVLSPAPDRVARAEADVVERDLGRQRSIADRSLPAQTEDGHRVTVLANVVSAAEVRSALEMGAEGAGLIRTEMAFLGAAAWPTEEEHRRALEPVLGGLRGYVATVRLLDFGADKTPPFLRGTPLRGLDLMLGYPEAVRAQLRAVLDLGRECELRILLPMVQSAVALMMAREALIAAATSLAEVTVPALGAMIETPEAAAIAAQLAVRSEFLSIGTNDLTHATLDADRFAPGDARPHHPRVLAEIARSVEAARCAAIPIEVCGEAASDPVAMPLLVGLGVDELSVGAARVGAARALVRALRHDAAADLAQRALRASSAAEVATLVHVAHGRSALVGEPGDAALQSAEGNGRVSAVGP
jgi:phosphoenolpyruvate-protein kinase (PTS system EI component)